MRNRQLAAALVGAQFTLLTAQFLTRRRADRRGPEVTQILGGTAIGCGAVVAAAAAAGLGAGLTASPLPNAAAQLRTTGMYRWVRHPIYSGLLLISAGRTLSCRGWRQVALSAALFAVLRYKSGFEETALRSRFPGYDRYAQITPRFVPSPHRTTHEGPQQG